MENWSVKELKAFLSESHVDYSHCIEKSELLNLAKQQPPRPKIDPVHGLVRLIHSNSEWESALQEAGSKLVAVDFFATWCGPCKFISPKFVELSKQFTNVVFLKVDVDEVRDVAQKCEISAMPTFQIFRNKSKLGEVVGADERSLRQLIEKNM